ncbi:MAG: DUF3179 domain-containing (seleno)protein [Cyclobacteriaceae bacterium]
MKKLFYLGLLALGIFEILKVYFIMPMPGSQQFNSIDVAYFLHSYRWYFRIAFGIMIALGSIKTLRGKRKWIPALPLALVLVIIYYFNFKMSADYMFLQPEQLVFKPRAENVLSDSSIVIAVSQGIEAKAYPVRFIAYHHQVRDTVNGKPIMVTYCNVCRTGRVYEPFVNGEPEEFRLVGMDHFNAMFEDETTKSWWQQSTGQAITGKLKGNMLPEFQSSQLTLNKFFSIYPFGKVMQEGGLSKENYDTLARFEKGRSKGKLTRTDSLSWKDKSWVVGIQVREKTKAYDWSDLKRSTLIHDQIGNTPIVIALSEDGQSFVVFRRNSETETFTLSNDSLISNENRYDFAGRGSNGQNLQSVKGYQEFWHSWKTFHPDTEIYKSDSESR